MRVMPLDCNRCSNLIAGDASSQFDGSETIGLKRDTHFRVAEIPR
jgi:hypothetical protein